MRAKPLDPGRRKAQKRGMSEAIGGLGGRSLNATLGETFALTDPELVRERVLRDGAEHFCTGLIEALKRRHPKTGRVSERWAYLLFAKICKLVGVQVDIAMLVVQQIGVPLSEAKVLVERAKESEGMPESELAERMREWLARYDAAHGREGVQLLGSASNGGGNVSVIESGDDRPS